MRWRFAMRSEGCRCGLDGPVDASLSRLGDLSDQPAILRIDQIERADIGSGRHELPANEVRKYSG